MESIDELAALLREEGGLLADALGPVRAEPTSEDHAVAPVFALGVEAIREGYACHYGTSRLLALEDDPDLALLAGDRLYALGLAALAATGDLVAVRTMADVIASAAAGHGADDPAAARRAWAIGTRTLRVGQ